MEDTFRFPVAAKGSRPYFLKDKDVENAINMIMALAGEVSVLRTRFHALERLLEKNNILPDEAVDSYKVTDEDAAKLDEWQNNFIRIILRPVYAEMEREAGGKSAKSYEDAIKAAEQ